MIGMRIVRTPYRYVILYLYPPNPSPSGLFCHIEGSCGFGSRLRKDSFSFGSGG